MAARPNAIAEVRALYAHVDFDLKNPNRARSVIGAFAAGNQVRFHDGSGEGYSFLADAVIALDQINGQTAARMVGPLGQWRRQNAQRAERARDLGAPAGYDVTSSLPAPRRPTTCMCGT